MEVLFSADRSREAFARVAERASNTCRVDHKDRTIAKLKHASA